MQYDDFIGEVQHRLELATQGEAVRSTRAFLTTLGERLQEGEASDLAGSLPMEIDRYLEEADSGQIFDYSEFVDRVAEREEADPSDAAFHAQAIMALVADCVQEGEMDDLHDQFPEDYDDLFEMVGAEATPW